jgi:hypothetical protein
MKCAVLCNGPSRVAYIPSTEYDFVIGCNIPWTDVDATVVLDEAVVELWAKTPDLIKVPTYFSVAAWRQTDAVRKYQPREFFKKFMVEIITPMYPFHSSGHNACEIAIKKGYKQIDIYGCDSWFSSVVESYTRSFVPKGGAEGMKHVQGWRKRWHEIMTAHPDVTLNFIKHENIHTT